MACTALVAPALAALLAAAPGPAAPPPAAPTLSVEQVIEGAPPHLTTLTLDQARQLPGVLRETTRSGPSEWKPGSTAEFRTVVLQGLALTFVIHPGERPFLVGATYTAPSWVLPGGLAVGARGELVRRLLGPGGREGAKLRYVSAIGAPGIVEITLKGDVVAEITLVPYSS